MLLADDTDLISNYNDVLPDSEQEEVFSIITAFQRYENRASGLQYPSSAAREEEEAPMAVDTPPSRVQGTAQFNTRPQVTSFAPLPSMPLLDSPMEEEPPKIINQAEFPSSATREKAAITVETPPLNDNTKPQVVSSSALPSMPSIDIPVEKKSLIIAEWSEFLFSGARKKAPIVVNTPPRRVQKTFQFLPLKENIRPQVISRNALPSMPSIDIPMEKKSSQIIAEWSEFLFPSTRKKVPRRVQKTVQHLPLNENIRPQVIFHTSLKPSMPSIDIPREEKSSQIISEWSEFLSSAVREKAPIVVNTAPKRVQENKRFNTRPQVIFHTSMITSMPSLDSPLEEEPPLAPVAVDTPPTGVQETVKSHTSQEPPLNIAWPELPATPPQSSPDLSEEEVDVVGPSPRYQLEKKFYPYPVVIPGKSLPELRRYPELDDPAEPIPADEPTLEELTQKELTPYLEPTPEVSQPFKKQRINEQYSHSISEILQQEAPEPIHGAKLGQKKLKRPPTIPGEFYCELCDKNFSIMRALIQHQNVHHRDPRPFRCDLCGKKFPDEAALSNHTKAHSEKNFRCSECGRGYQTRQSYGRHYTVHHGQGRFHCHICPRKFARNDHLDKHITSHLIGTAHKCDPK